MNIIKNRYFKNLAIELVKLLMIALGLQFRKGCPFRGLLLSAIYSIKNIYKKSGQR